MGRRSVEPLPLAPPPRLQRLPPPLQQDLAFSEPRSGCRRALRRLFVDGVDAAEAEAPAACCGLRLRLLFRVLALHGLRWTSLGWGTWRSAPLRLVTVLVQPWPQRLVPLMPRWDQVLELCPRVWDSVWLCLSFRRH